MGAGVSVWWVVFVGELSVGRCFVLQPQVVAAGWVRLGNMYRRCPIFFICSAEHNLYP